MQRFLVSLFALSALSVAHAQTIKITTASGPCTYPTGTVTSDPATPGQLLATVPLGQTPTGTGCGSSGGTNPVSFGPASPLTITGTSIVGNSGGPVNFTFQPLNATACTASSSPSGVTFSTMCSSLSGCQTPQSLTATMPANASNTTDAVYTVSVTCTGAGSPATSSVTPVTVSHGSVVTSTCPVVPGNGTNAVTSFTQYTGTHTINYYSTSKSVDVASFDSLYGTWPGNNSLTPVISLAKNMYLSEKFHVPAGYMAGYTGAGALYGTYPLNSSGGSTPTSMTISTSCGDFSNPSASGSTVVPGCWIKNHTSASSGPLQWRRDTTCILSDDTDYYLNIINADITNVLPNNGGTATSKCASTACTTPVNLGGSFSSYTFP